MRGTKEKHEHFPGSNLCTPLQLTNLSLSLSLSLPLSVVFAGRSALCQDIMPSLSTYPHQAYLQETDGVGGHSLAPPNCWKRHIESPPPHRGPPGNLPPLARRPLCTHISLKEQTLLDLLALSLIHVSMFFSLSLSLSLSGLREDGWLSAMPSSTEGADLPSLTLPLRV